MSDFELNSRVTTALAQVDAMIKEVQREGSNFEGMKIAVPVYVEDFAIHEAQRAEAEALLRQLPEELAVQADCRPGWRDKSLPDMLEAWGWGTYKLTVPGHEQTQLVGIYGDVVFKECFAALAAIAPVCTEGVMVFAPDRHYPEYDLFAVKVSGGRLSVEPARREVSFEY